MDLIWDLVVSLEVGNILLGNTQFPKSKGMGANEIHHELKMDSAVSREQTEVGIWGE